MLKIGDAIIDGYIQINVYWSHVGFIGLKNDIFLTTLHYFSYISERALFSAKSRQFNFRATYHTTQFNL